MKICILKETLAIGGNERSVSNVSKILEKNNDVFVALFDADNMQYPYGGELFNFALPAQRTIIGKIAISYLRAIALERLVKKNSVDIVYMFTRIGNYQTQARLGNTIKIISARDCASMVKKHRRYNNALRNSDAIICNSEYIKNYYLSRYPGDHDKVFVVYNTIHCEEIIQQSIDEVEQEYIDFIGKHGKKIGRS